MHFQGEITDRNKKYIFMLAGNSKTGNAETYTQIELRKFRNLYTDRIEEIQEPLHR